MGFVWKGERTVGTSEVEFTIRVQDPEVEFLGSFGGGWSGGNEGSEEGERGGDAAGRNHSCGVV